MGEPGNGARGGPEGKTSTAEDDTRRPAAICAMEFNTGSQKECPARTTSRLSSLNRNGLEIAPLQPPPLDSISNSLLFCYQPDDPAHPKERRARYKRPREVDP